MSSLSPPSLHLHRYGSAGFACAGVWNEVCAPLPHTHTQFRVEIIVANHHGVISMCMTRAFSRWIKFQFTGYISPNYKTKKTISFAMISLIKNQMVDASFCPSTSCNAAYVTDDSTLTITGSPSWNRCREATVVHQPCNQRPVRWLSLYNKCLKIFDNNSYLDWKTQKYNIEVNICLSVKMLQINIPRLRNRMLFIAFGKCPQSHSKPKDEKKPA